MVGTKLASVLFAFIIAVVIGSIVIPCIIVSSVLIVRGVTAIIVHVFVFIVGSASDTVVIIGSRVFTVVCIIKQRFRIRILPRRVLLSTP